MIETSQCYFYSSFKYNLHTYSGKYFNCGLATLLLDVFEEDEESLATYILKDLEVVVRIKV